MVTILAVLLAIALTTNVYLIFRQRKLRIRRPDSLELQEFLADLHEGGALLQDTKGNQFAVRPVSDSEGKRIIELKRLDPEEFVLHVRNPKQR